MRRSISKILRHTKSLATATFIVFACTMLGFEAVSISASAQVANSSTYPQSPEDVGRTPVYPYHGANDTDDDQTGRYLYNRNTDRPDNFAYFSSQTDQGQNIRFSSGRDCDNNAVLNCGAMSTDELYGKYYQSESAQTIFEYFGMSSETVRNMERYAVAGKVHRDGRVTVDGDTVATGAYTVGRQNMTGSNRVEEGDTTFYTRSPSVSFRSDGLDAFVVLDENGQYTHAVIASCGNPVRANPVPVEVAEKEVPTPEPVPVPEPEPEPTILPVTGAGAAVAIATASATTLGTFAHHIYTRRRR